MSDLFILILAAGKGTRMYSAIPKVLHTIAGKPMLARVIETALSMNPQSIGVVVGHGRDQVRAAIEYDVLWIEQNEQLGTGHAVQVALPYLPRTGKTLILYGDVPLIDAENLQKMCDLSVDDAPVLLTDIVDNPQGYGRIIRDENQQIKGIVEEKDASGAQKQIREINTGMMLLPNRYLEQWLCALRNDNAQGEYYLTDLIHLACADGLTPKSVVVDRHECAAGVNNKLQQAQLERIFQRNQAEILMKEGVTLADPNRLDIRGTVQHGQDVFLDVNVIIEGDCILGDGVVIESGCVLRNVTIGNGTRVRAFSHLEECSVGQNVSIGPFARLRPQAKLADDVHIGNFVEVKKSDIGTGSKINHLTYIGDTTMGSHCNIGAGTITCNYDGVNKFRTEVGDDVFIGSGCMMVAPVKIGDGATTGAGSVITKDCPAHQLTIERARQITLPQWKRPIKQ